MPISIQVEVDGAVRDLEILADSFAEIRPVFAKFSVYMRGEIQAVFDSDGGGKWPERKVPKLLGAEAKAAKIEKIRSGQYSSLSGAIRSSQRKAARLLARTPQSESKLTERRRKSIEKYQSQLEEIERIGAGGSKDQKGFRKLYERAGRREDRAAKKIERLERGALLGQIANSFSIDFDKTAWEMFSRIDWAGVHNEGGSAGHGAKIPARVFLEWTPERIEKFVAMANEYLANRADKSKGSA